MPGQQRLLCLNWIGITGNTFRRPVWPPSGQSLGRQRIGSERVARNDRAARQAAAEPLVHHQERDRFLIYAPAGGADHHPAWYHDLVANPALTVEVDTETVPMRATVMTGAERERSFAEHVAHAMGFWAYRRKTT